MEEKRYAPCPECGGLNGGHSSYKCPKMTLEEAQNKIIEVEQRWIKVNSRMAAGNQKSFSRLKNAIVFYQGKYTLLKEENNKLRQNATKRHQANETIKELESKVANLGACLVLCSDIIPRDTYPELMDSIKKYLKTYKIKDLDGE